MEDIKAPWEVAVMRSNGRKLAEIAAVLHEMIAPGVSSSDLDRVAEEKILALGARPSFKGYTIPKAPPYPATICASLNEQVVHGIPNRRPLEEGDLLSVDMGLVYGGYHVDMAFTVAIGEADPKIATLIEVTRRALYAGIARAKGGSRTGDVGHAIESVASPHRFGVVRQYVGHGIGRSLHERPSVPNYGKVNTGDLLRPGMCLAVEPMITLGSYDTKILRDGWTVVTRDRSLAAHFEHTITITSEGAQILTELPGHPLLSDDPLTVVHDSPIPSDEPALSGEERR